MNNTDVKETIPTFVKENVIQKESKTNNNEGIGSILDIIGNVNKEESSNKFDSKNDIKHSTTGINNRKMSKINTTLSPIKEETVQIKNPGGNSAVSNTKTAIVRIEYKTRYNDSKYVSFLVFNKYIFLFI